MILILLFAVLISGCSQWAAEQRAQEYAACANLNDPSWLPETQREFMSRCLPAARVGGSAPSYANTSVSYAPNPFGRADAFGPYGYRGPTWERFDNQFQQSPPATVIAPIR